MTAEERSVIEMAAAHDRCKFSHEDAEFYPEKCDAPDCLHCRAAALLPELRCACAKWVLDRSAPSMYEMPVYHRPDACRPPDPKTHCDSCRQPLPRAAPTAPHPEGK